MHGLIAQFLRIFVTSVFEICAQILPFQYHLLNLANSKDQNFFVWGFFIKQIGREWEVGGARKENSTGKIGENMDAS